MQTSRLTGKREWMLTERGFDEVLRVSDVPAAEKEVLVRELTDEEVVAVGNLVGDYIDRFQAVENAIYKHVRV